MKTTNNPRVLFFDIETRPNLSYVWGRWEQDVIENVSDWSFLSFAYKWEGDKTVKAYSLPDFKSYKKNQEDDKELVTKLWELFNEADIVVAHNGNDFDIKKANARFLVHGLPPPTPFKSIDTKLVAKLRFKFDSNKLDELGRQLGIGQKISTGGFATWKGCMSGDMKSWFKMVKYNKHDVVLLEKVYLKLRPWITNFPITHLDNGNCYHCHADTLQKRGYRFNKSMRFQRYQCTSCGAWSSGKGEKI